jgi:radical SAM protein
MTTISAVAEHLAYPGVRDYSQRPLIVYWEMTQACGLACRHCRAEAMPKAHPQQLTHVESQDVLRQIVAFGHPMPHLILTGGDPLERPDLFELIAEAMILGLKVSITPAATKKLTNEVITRLQAQGIQSLGLSLDGSNAVRHEAVRGVEGCFDWTTRAARFAADIAMPVQINTLVSRETVDDLPAIYELLKTLGIMRWSLFFLIPVGRGKELQELTPTCAEELMNWVYEVSREAPFAIKTTEAPFYRRVALSRMIEEGWQSDQMQRTPVYHGFGIRDGHGVLFLSHTGNIYPSGFLPLSMGNIRSNSMVDIYRESPICRSLHDPNEFHGKCGDCTYRAICGGSRARAFSQTGDALQSDPLCPYEPKHKP